MPITEEGYRYIEGNLLREIEQLRKVVQTVAALKGDVYVYSDNSGDSSCIFCGDVIGYGTKEKHKPQHASDCAYLLATQLMEQGYIAVHKDESAVSFAVYRIVDARIEGNEQQGKVIAMCEEVIE